MKQHTTMTIGMDLGDRWTVVVGIDGSGEVRMRMRVKTRAPELQEALESWPRSRVVMEVGTHSPWVSRLAVAAGHEVIVANARRVKLISASRNKSDRIDAELLARLGQADPRLLAPIQHRPAEAQVDLALIKTRAALVDARTSLINHVRGQVKAWGFRLPTCSAESFYKHESEIPESLLPALEPAMKQIRELSLRIRELEGRIEDLSTSKYPITEILREIPGVGPVTALTFVLTIGDPKRFTKMRDVGCYLGLKPGRNQSGDVDRALRISKQGNSYLRQLLVQCAHHIMERGPASDLREFGLRLFGRGGKYAKQRAAVAVARKLAVLLTHLWRTGNKYDPLYNLKRSGAKVYEIENAA